MKIYVVTQGCYSDYHIVAVFIDEDKAKEFVEHKKSGKTYAYADDFDIEVYDSNDYDKLGYNIYISSSLYDLKNIDISVSDITMEAENSQYYSQCYDEFYHERTRLRISRFVRQEQFENNRDFWIEKYKKAFIDLNYIVRQKKEEGFNSIQIRELIGVKYD